ncbi:hypothetical protein OOU_Y34scaffold00166g4 [Pyricularia oryzae Y34]|uniref:Uncharacterized protein n=2 Tax=Pyricularia oryzae TaxID=318829 RepID=A0AA97PQP6_PYRO3|nr:hypothetical protein OOU_Y34scaffold00166g4 [Pyricularia oryzae Y34]
MLALQTSAQKITVCQVELWGADSTKPSDTAWVSPGGIARFTVKFGRHSLFLYAKTSGDCTPSPVLEGPSRWGTHTIKGSLQEKQKGTVLIQESCISKFDLALRARAPHVLIWAGTREARRGHTPPSDIRPKKLPTDRISIT